MASTRLRLSSILVIVIAVLAALNGCSTGSGLAGGNPPGAPPLALLPPLPLDAASAHGVSVAQDTTINGSDSLDQSAGASVSGTGLQLTSTAGGIEWGMYELLTGGATLVSVKVDFTPQTGSSVWLGLADYTRMAWDISGPYVSGTSVPLGTDDLSPAGNLYFLVVAYNGTAILENNATVTTDVTPTSFTINMNSAFAFDPQTANVDPGMDVVFDNTSAFPHAPVTDPLNAASGGPDSDPTFPLGVPAGQSYTWHVPNDAVSGTQWFYHCRFHGVAGDGSHLGTGMVGVITVN